MATETGDSQVQTGTAPDPATAAPAPESAATETLSQSPRDVAADANADLMARFNSPVAPVAEEKTDEKAQAVEPPTVPKEEPSQAQAAAVEPAEGEEDDVPNDGKDGKGQMRPRLHDPEDIAIASIAKAKKVTLAQAADIYRGKATPEGADIPNLDQQPSPVETLTGEVNRINTELAEVNNQLKAKKESGDRFTDEYFDLVERKADLAREYADKKSDLTDAQREVKQQTQTAQQSHEQIVVAQESNRAEALKAFPSINDPESDLYAVTQAVVAEMKAANSPDLFKPDAPMIVAERSAERLAKALEKSAGIPKATTLARIKPVATPAAPPAPAPLSLLVPPKPAPARVAPASPAKGQAPSNKPSTVGELFASITTAAEGNDALLALSGGGEQNRRRGS